LLDSQQTEERLVYDVLHQLVVHGQFSSFPSDAADILLELRDNKTKVMATQDSTCKLEIVGRPVEQVDVFTYLGSLFTHDVQSTKDIKAKLGKAKALMTGLKTLWQGIAMLTKLRLMRSLIWPAVSYDCKSWTLKNSDENQINSFEMKSPRQLLRVSWTDRRTDDWITESRDKT